MKTFKLIVFGMMLMLAGTTYGQLSVRVNVGTPPAWGPAGYNDVRYYYLPDIECYYDVQTSMFVYPMGNRWVHSRALPARYRGYDLYHGYKVTMNGYHGNTPYLHFRENRMSYGKGYRGREQHNIGERHENHDRGREGVQSNRNFHGNERGGDRNVGRDNHQERGKGQNDHGNDKNKNEGHDNGNRK